MEKVKGYIEANRERFINELFELLRIPSVSAKDENKGDMVRCAEHLKGVLLEAGADRAEVFATKGHPVLFAEKIVDESLPTVLVYGHYDVQPAEPLELWKSPPFEPEIRDGKIYARGADDDKGQFFMHVKAFELMVKEGILPCNIKFMIEGEEEIGSPNLESFCLENRDMIAADVILISDTPMIALETPTVTTGLRGMAYMEVELTGPNRDLHSGLYGGAVINPCNVLCDMISKLTDEDNRITIPGFYDDVIEVDSDERREMAKRPHDDNEYSSEIGVDYLGGEKGYSTIERLGIRPSLDVNGIWGGYTGEGAKTILPSKAFAKISMRLVPDQDFRKVEKQFDQYFRSLAPEGITVKTRVLHGGQAYVSPLDSPEYEAAAMALEETFGMKPIPVRSGGSIPIVSVFEKALDTKSILIGFGLDSNAIHSPNEHFPLFSLFKGIETIPLYFKYYSQLKGGQE